jgi:predicted DNA-binding protein (UPF0251 family)
MRNWERPFSLTAKESEALSLKHLEPDEAARRMRIKIGSYKHVLLRAREKVQAKDAMMAAFTPSNPPRPR